MHFEDLLAALNVWVRHHDLAVETARPQKCGIENVGSVGGGDQDDAFIGFKAVHFDEQLVQRLLALIVATAQARTAMAADRVDFVDEDDAGGTLLGLLEHVAHARCTHTHEHFNEVGTGNREERHIGFAGNRPRQQRLAGAGRTDQQRAFWNLAAEALELVRILQEVDDLDQIVLGLFDASHIFKRDLAVALGQQLGLGFAEAHGLARPRLHLADEEHPHADQQQHRQPVDQRVGQQRVALRGAEVDFDVLVAQFLDLVFEIHQRAGGLNRRPVRQLADDRVAGDGDGRDRPGIGLVEEFRITDFGGSSAPDLALEQAEQREQQQCDDDPDGEIAELIHVVPRILPLSSEAAAGSIFPRMKLNIGWCQDISKDAIGVNAALRRCKPEEADFCRVPTGFRQRN